MQLQPAHMHTMPYTFFKLLVLQTTYCAFKTPVKKFQETHAMLSMIQNLTLTIKSFKISSGQLQETVSYFLNIFLQVDRDSLVT